MTSVNYSRKEKTPALGTLLGAFGGFCRSRLRVGLSLGDFQFGWILLWRGEREAQWLGIGDAGGGCTPRLGQLRPLPAKCKLLVSACSAGQVWTPGTEVTRRARGSRCPSLEVLKPHVGSGAAGCGVWEGDAAAVPGREVSLHSVLKKKTFSISLSSPRPTPASGTRTL